MTRHRLAPGAPDDGNAGDYRGGLDGGGFPRLSGVLPPDGPRADEPAEAGRAPGRTGAADATAAAHGCASGQQAAGGTRAEGAAGAAPTPAAGDGRCAALPGRGEQRGRKAPGAHAEISRRKTDG